MKISKYKKIKKIGKKESIPKKLGSKIVEYNIALKARTDNLFCAGFALFGNLFYNRENDEMKRGQI